MATGFDTGRVRRNYDMLASRDPQEVAAEFEACGFMRLAPAEIEPGDVLLVSAGAGHLHAAILTPDGYLHADARLRRVVEVPGAVPWPISRPGESRKTASSQSSCTDMATLILTAVGTAVGGPIGGAIGAILGQTIDQRIFAPKARQGPRLGELSVQTSSYGSAIPKLFGTMRVAGTVIWATDLVEQRSTSGGGKGRPKTVNYSYSASFAVALSARPIRSVGRIWADGKLLRGAGGDFKSATGFRLHLGGEDQAADPLIASAEGAALAPAYRGLAYAVFEDLQLEDFGNRIPSLSFEVEADPGPVAIGAIAEALGEGRGRGRRDAGCWPVMRRAATASAAAIEALAEAVPLSLADTGALAPAERRGRRPGARSAPTRRSAGASWSGAAPGRSRARSASPITNRSATIRPGCSGPCAATAAGPRTGGPCRRRCPRRRRRRWPSAGSRRSGPDGPARRSNSAGGAPACRPGERVTLAGESGELAGGALDARADGGEAGAGRDRPRGGPGACGEPGTAGRRGRSGRTARPC